MIESLLISAVIGTLHCSVFEDRLRQEHGASIIITAPTVPFKIKYKNGTEAIIRNPHEFPSADSDFNKMEGFYEPLVVATITVPEEYLGNVIELCEVIPLPTSPPKQTNSHPTRRQTAGPKSNSTSGRPHK